MAVEGTELRHGEEVLIAESVDDWLVQIERLLHDDILWSRISAAGLAHARRHYSHQQGRRLMCQALQRLALAVQEAPA